MIGFIGTSLQLQIDYSNSHIELLKDVCPTNLSLISDWSLLLLWSLSTWIHESTVFYKFRAAPIEDTMSSR
jgi:hypothetical protein